jgi:Putative 8-oxoguanine DNA glycosylase OGG-like protein
MLAALPDHLDRSTVRQLVLEKPPTASGMFEATVIVYAWGWSTTPVGVTRAQTAVGVGTKPLGLALLAARDAVRTSGPLDGYAALAGPHRVAGLGPSFGSKFLYFVSPEGRRALILDQLVATWLDREAALSLNATRWSIRTYTTYLTTMDRWSSRLGIPDHQLEEIIFTAEATRRGLGTWGAGR